MGKHALPPPRGPRAQVLVVAASVAILVVVATVFLVVGSRSKGVAFTAADVASASPTASMSDPYVVSADPTPTTPPSEHAIVRAGGTIEHATDAPASDGVAALRASAQNAAAKVAAREAAASSAAAEPRTSSFRVATLNVLGSNHTSRPGGFGPGTTRAAGEAALIRDRGIDLVGMSEVQPDQYAAFTRDLPGYTVWPQGALGANGYRLQIAWLDSRFEMVDSGTTQYLFSGQHIPMPYALLRDRATGASFWVIATHNSPRGMESERLTSTQIEIGVIRQLQAQGHPVLLLGDMNEGAAVYCRIGAGTGMISANGGSYDGGCHAPSPSYIDWIMGTRDVDFSAYVRDTITRSRGLSDHPIYYANAQVTDSAPAADSAQ